MTIAHKWVLIRFKLIHNESLLMARRPRDRIGVQLVLSKVPQLVAWTARG